MQIATFRKNVMKTVNAKPVKMGLRQAAKNTARTNTVHATISLKTHTGQLLQTLSNYVLGLQMTQEMKDGAQVVLGDIGYDLTILCRVLKVKMPSATKKIKLSGTRTAALLALDGMATELLAIVERGTFAGPQMETVTKVVVLPNKQGAKEERQVSVVNAEAEAAAEAERQTAMRSLLSGAVDIFWRLSFDLYGKPPAMLFAGKFARLQQQYPGVEFDVTEEKQAENEPVPA